MGSNIYQIYTPKVDKYPLIHDVIIKKLIVNSDNRGNLVEILKSSWTDVYDEKTLPFTQVYYSQTKQGLARDRNHWHFHPGGQVDRYVIVSGDVIFAIYDIREESKSVNVFNLFWVGESLGPQMQYMLLVPARTLHGFLVVGNRTTTLLNFPSRLYDPKEESRLPFADYPLPDGSIFSWDKVNAVYNKYAK